MKTYYDTETAPATNGTCDYHNEPLALIGRMDPAAPLEYVCYYCMNNLDKVCLHKSEGNCKGDVEPFTTDYGTPTAMCDQHQLDYYKRQDAIRSNYR